MTLTVISIVISVISIVLSILAMGICLIAAVVKAVDEHVSNSEIDLDKE